MITLFYIQDIDEVIKLHERVLEISGGLPGIKNIGYIESPLQHIQNDMYYPEFEMKLNHLIFSINKFHAFEDGNKRTSVAVGAKFLELNGFGYVVSKFLKEMENIAVCVADDIISKEFLQEIVYSIIYEDDYDEDLKIRIAESLEKQIEQQDKNLENIDNEDDIF